MLIYSIVKLHDLLSYLFFVSDPEDRFSPRPVLARFVIASFTLVHYLLRFSLDVFFFNLIYFFDFSDDFRNSATPHLVFCNRTPDEVLAAKGVKPTLSPNLNTLALVEVLSNYSYKQFFRHLISVLFGIHEALTIKNILNVLSLSKLEQ